MVSGAFSRTLITGVPHIIPRLTFFSLDDVRQAEHFESWRFLWTCINSLKLRETSFLKVTERVIDVAKKKNQPKKKRAEGLKKRSRSRLVSTIKVRAQQELNTLISACLVQMTLNKFFSTNIIIWSNIRSTQLEAKN